ncbi:MAG TPA: insulinase family protein [Burkholderiales bacterium]|nr:insulinase family protein [Burkholderiales bacterium]
MISRIFQRGFRVAPFAARLLLALLLVVPAAARQLPDSASWPQDHSDLKRDASVVYGRLDNGVRYVLMPNDTPKGRISLRLLVAAGSLMETEDQRGLAHFLEHMAFKGSQNMPAGDLVHYLERLGMAFGADTNAHTAFEETVYQLELPSNDSGLVDKSLIVMRETADRLLILAPELDRERGVILSEERIRDTPDYRATVSNLSFLLPDSLIPRRFPIGLDAVIENAPRQRLVDFYRTWYRPERITLVAVGAIDPAAFARYVKGHFESMRATSPPRPNPDIGTIAARGPAARLYSDPDGQTHVTLQSVSYADPGPDTRASREHDILLYLANGVVSRRLASLALNGNASFINGSAQVNDLLRFARIGSVSMECKPDQWRQALATAEQELRRALEYGFTAAELEEQKKNLLSMFEQQAKGAATRDSPELANDLVEHLGEFNVFTDPAYDLAELQRVLPGITSERALEALRGLWKGGGPLVFVTGPITLERPEGQILQVLEASAARPVTPPTDGAVQKFAYTEFGSPARLVEKKVAPVLDVIQARFGNNVRLNLKRTVFDANSVLVGIRFGGGRLELPRDKPGLKLLAESAFINGGLQKHSFDELNRITAGRNISLDLTVDDDAFVFTGHTTPDDLLLQLQIMAAYLTAPGYRPEALERFRQSLGPLYVNLTRTPSGVLQSRVARYLRDGDPRFGYPDQEEVATRTSEELQAWLAPPLSTGYLEISLVGDFDPDAALQAVASTFGSLPTRDAEKPPYTAQRDVRFPARRQLATFTFASRDPKAYAAVYWPTTDFSHISEVRRLFVLAKALEGRILERIRVQEGLSYTAQSANLPSMAFPGYGLLLAVVDAKPDKALELTQQIRDIGARIALEGVTQDELERARNPVVSALRKLLMDNNYLLSAIVSGSQEQPQRLMRAATSLAELEALTTADLNQVARKYLQPEDALPVVVVPAQTTGKLPPAQSVTRESLSVPAH